MASHTNQILIARLTKKTAQLLPVDTKDNANMDEAKAACVCAGRTAWCSASAEWRVSGHAEACPPLAQSIEAGGGRVQQPQSGWQAHRGWG